MFKGQGNKALIGAHQPGKGDSGAEIGAAGQQRGLYDGGVEGLALEPRGNHPPVTGGKMAISRGLFSGVAAVAKA